MLILHNFWFDFDSQKIFTKHLPFYFSIKLVIYIFDSDFVWQTQLMIIKG